MGGPIGAFVGGAIGGVVNAAFGHGATELTASGTRGTFSGSSFSGTNYANYKQEGGWFSSDRNWTTNSAIDPATLTAWSSAFAGVKGSMAGMAESLGLATDKIIAYSKAVDIAAGTTQEQITAIFTGMADDMARAAAPGIKEFGKIGETASVTLERLSGSLTTANAWLSMLRNRLFDISLSGADAASKLADAFGSLDNLAASSKAYYDAFYTEAERTAISTENLAKAMALIGIAIPDTKQAFRDVVSGLDLTTDSGRAAYAVMLALAPEFDTASQAADRMAQTTAKAIIKTFTGNHQLLPALNAASLAIGDVADGAGSMTTSLSYINKVMGDSSSGVITLGGTIRTLGTGLTGSQKSAALLNDQIFYLQDNADRTRINFVGLNEALANVNTETFVATIGLVFENLAARISGVIGDITTERIAVREAALQIVNPTVMSKEQIARGIAGINTGLPSNAGVVAANKSLVTADSSFFDKRAALVAAQKTQTDEKDALDAFNGKIAYYKNLSGQFQNIINSVGGTAWSPTGGAAYKYDDATNRLASWRDAWWPSVSAKNNALNALRGSGYTSTKITNPDSIVGQLSGLGGARSANTVLAEAESDLALARSKAVKDLTPYTDAVTTAQAAQAAAAAAAKQAALDYASALQNFAIDASKSVTKLGRLREETVKYYDAQKALADLMSTSAAGLRKSVADYRYGQLSPEQQLASLQSQFSAAYTMALASQGDGATLAGYGEKVNSLLGPLIDKLGETGSNNLIGNYLAQAESIASLIEATTPVNYQQESLDLLDSIDETLAALEDSSLSAERIIADAVDAGAERTSDGLRAVIAAITGNTIPAFAAGGYHRGGVRLVGENGPELEVTGPSRIFNAGQTSSIMGNTARLEALVERQGKQLENMSYELRAIASNTGKTTKTLDRITPNGDSLQVEVAA